MIIAIAGVKRSGKDTAAQYLIDNWQYVTPIVDEKSLFAANTFDFPFQMHHFADPLKRALEGIYGWDKGIWDTPEKEEIDPFWGCSPRQAAQVLGTEWSIMMSEKFPEYAKTTGRKTYLKAFQRFVEEHRGRHYILPDMRFQYESEAMREMGALTLRIRRPQVEAVKDPHPSEQEILSLDVDVEIVNDGTLEELYAALDFYAESQHFIRF